MAETRSETVEGEGGRRLRNRRWARIVRGARCTHLPRGDTEILVSDAIAHRRAPFKLHVDEAAEDVALENRSSSGSRERRGEPRGEPRGDPSGEAKDLIDSATDDAMDLAASLTLAQRGLPPLVSSGGFCSPRRLATATRASKSAFDSACR